MDKRQKPVFRGTQKQHELLTIAKLRIEIAAVAAGNGDPRASEYEHEARQAIDEYKRSTCVASI